MAKMSKQELKTPDQVWQASKSTMNWLAARGLQLGIALAVVLAIIIGWVYSNQLAKKEEGQAQYHLSMAKTHFEQWKLEKKDADKEKALASLTAELTNLETKFPKSAAQHLAMLIRAELAVSDKKWKEVPAYFESYANFLPDEDKPMGLYPLAQAYEQAGEYEKALKAYDDILKLKNSSYEERSYLGKARSQRLLGKYEEAEKTYQEFLENFPDSSQTGSVRGLIALTRQAKQK
jgi:tetratricopeptide (TPR) repeat protein